MRRNLRARSPSESLSNPPKSKPPEKPLPAPLKTQSRVPSLAATPSASIKASTKPSLKAFSFSGRFRVRTARGPSRSTRSSLDIALRLFPPVCCRSAPGLCAPPFQPIPKDRLVIGAQFRRSAPDLEVIAADVDWKGGRAGPGTIGQFQVSHQPHRLHLGIGQDLGIAIDRRRRHTAPIHFFQPFGRSPLREPFTEYRRQFILVAGALRLGHEARILRQLRQAHRLGHLAPEGIVSGGYDEVVVGGLEGLIGRIPGMGGAETAPITTGAK